MKKKIFMACAALVVLAAAVVGVKAYNYYSMPELMRANLEALTELEGVDDCDIKIYNRNQVEAYDYFDIEHEIGGGFYFSYNGVKIPIKLSAQYSGGKVGLPVCKDKTDNCCRKSWINANPKYILW